MKQATADRGSHPKQPTRFPLAVYLWLVILAGFAGFVFSLDQLQVLWAEVWLWAGLAVLTALAGWLGLKIRLRLGGTGSLVMTLGDCFVFLAFLLISPLAAVLIAAVEGLVTDLRYRVSRLSRLLFNIAQVMLAAFVVAHFFYLLGGTTPPLEPALLNLWLVPKAAASALLYFLLNSGLIALAMALASKRQLVELWHDHFAWASPANLLNVSAALLLVLALDPARPMGPAWAAAGLMALILSFLYTRRAGSRAAAA